MGQLVKCMRGTCDAPHGWERTHRAVFEATGFRVERVTPCVIMHQSRRLYLTVHGDGFFAAGRAVDMKWFAESLLEAFEGRVKGRLVDPGDELHVFSRVVQRTEDVSEGEADQIRAELLMADVGLESDSRPLTNPGRKQPRSSTPSRWRWRAQQRRASAHWLRERTSWRATAQISRLR